MNVQVADVDAAVALALELKAKGEYDWFRGQTRTYPVVPTLLRLDEAAREEARKRVARFEAWLKATPGLEELAGDADKALAVAQHYGLATPFVDFTTSPEAAGFFASDCADPMAPELSCIICLQTQDLLEFWSPLPEQYPRPECLVIDVSNLWRLQAQEGVFLYCPYDEIESWYDFDRIYFPRAEPPPTASRRKLYPERKSQLELLLDQFFMNEQLITGSAYLAANFPVISYPSPPEGVDPHLTARPPERLPSWADAALVKWRSTFDERLEHARVDARVHLDVDVRADPRDAGARVTAKVEETLRTQPELRSALVDWSCVFSGYGLHLEPQVLRRSLAWLWDGVRTLSYDEQDIAAGFGTCVALHLARARAETEGGFDTWERAAAMALDDPIEVEFGARDGSYSRGYVSCPALLDCVREDIDAYLHDDYRSQLSGNPAALVQAIQDPSRLFEFDRLARLFVRELAPSQVLTRSGSAVFFSPARLERFGLP